MRYKNAFFIRSTEFFRSNNHFYQDLFAIVYIVVSKSVAGDAMQCRCHGRLRQKLNQEISAEQMTRAKGLKRDGSDVINQAHDIHILYYTYTVSVTQRIL